MGNIRPRRRIVPTSVPKDYGILPKEGGILPKEGANQPKANADPTVPPRKKNLIGGLICAVVISSAVGCVFLFIAWFVAETAEARSILYYVGAVLAGGTFLLTISKVVEDLFRKEQPLEADPDMGQRRYFGTMLGWGLAVLFGKTFGVGKWLPWVTHPNARPGRMKRAMIGAITLGAVAIL